VGPSTADSGFVPILPNPYIVGYPVRDPAMFFGRETEFELVRKRFKNADHGSLVVFCGERRSGKTSILLQIQQGRLGGEFIPVLIDMQAMVVENERDFFARTTHQMVAQLHDQRIADAVPDYSPGQASIQFRGFIETLLRLHPGRKPLFLVDEYELIEEMVDSGTLNSDMSFIVANLMENSPLFVIFTGSHPLSERRKDYWRFLEKAHEYRRIGYLHRSDAQRLIRDPVDGRVTYADDTEQRILRLAAGHPFYTQAICQNLVDALNDECTNRVMGPHLDVVVAQMVDSPFPQMIFRWQSLPREHKLTLALLAQVLQSSEVVATASQLLETLEEGGYGLSLALPTVSTALETLFGQELLSKDDAPTPGYNFRMDLWRLWVRRMHSVWQVMGEEAATTLAGGLIARGDVPARIFVDEEPVGSGELPSSGRRSVAPGSHVVEVVFRGGTRDRMTVAVAPNETVEIRWANKKLLVPPGR